MNEKQQERNSIMNRNRTGLLLTSALLLSTFCNAAELTLNEKQIRSEGAAAYHQALTVRKKDPKAYQVLLQKALDSNYPAAILANSAENITFDADKSTNYEAVRRQLAWLVQQPVDPGYYSAEQKAQAHYLLGVSSELGLGTLIDKTEACRQYLLGARLNPDARVALCRIFTGSRTVLQKAPVNGLDTAALLLYTVCLSAPEKAADLLQTRDAVANMEKTLLVLAENGDTAAMKFLGKSYLKGIYFPARKTRGLDFLEKAAVKGNPEAALILGDVYSKGLYGIAPDQAKGKNMYEKAFSHTATAVRAAEQLSKLCLQQNDPASALRYCIFAEKYDDALKIAKKLDEGKIGADTLYVQAKLYQKTKGASAEEYERKINMALNAGSLHALQERGGYSIHDQLEILKKLTKDPAPPAWYSRMGTLALRGIRSGSATKEDALKYIQTGAEKGEITSLLLLERAYTNGAPALGIKKDPAAAKQYALQILEQDYTGERTLQRADKMENPLQWFIRTAAYQPVCAYKLATSELTQDLPAAKLMLFALSAGLPDTISTADLELFLNVYFSDLKNTKKSAK